uniref:Uncharacterized protein n=1 Tax=Cucumis melo TaxID=3656 RepID=A0A9I9DLT3_CUCME
MQTSVSGDQDFGTNDNTTGRTHVVACVEQRQQRPSPPSDPVDIYVTRLLHYLNKMVD